MNNLNESSAPIESFTAKLSDVPESFLVNGQNCTNFFIMATQVRKILLLRHYAKDCI